MTRIKKIIKIKARYFSKLKMMTMKKRRERKINGKIRIKKMMRIRKKMKSK
jgi:hypothetical protein